MNAIRGIDNWGCVGTFVSSRRHYPISQSCCSLLLGFLQPGLEGFANHTIETGVPGAIAHRFQPGDNFGRERGTTHHGQTNLLAWCLGWSAGASLPELLCHCLYRLAWIPDIYCINTNYKSQAGSLIALLSYGLVTISHRRCRCRLVRFPNPQPVGPIAPQDSQRLVSGSQHCISQPARAALFERCLQRLRVIGLHRFNSSQRNLNSLIEGLGFAASEREIPGGTQIGVWSD